MKKEATALTVYLKRGLSTVAMMLVAAMSCPVHAQETGKPGICETDSFEDTKYIICKPDNGLAGLRLFWNGSDGKPYRTFSSAAKAVSDDGHSLIFAMNAGMYGPDFAPIGLYVENEQELRPANRQKGESADGPVPNFYKRPNGVFFWDDKAAGILPTDTFLKRRPKVSFATQSGPMLVIRNKLHPAFIIGSTDRTRRIGVGVCENGKVRFGIRDEPVNFHDFARMFRDHLKCPDALFLDGGNGTGIYDPTMGRNDISWHGGFGPIVGFVE